MKNATSKKSITVKEKNVSDKNSLKKDNTKVIAKVKAKVTKKVFNSKESVKTSKQLPTKRNIGKIVDVIWIV